MCVKKYTNKNQSGGEHGLFWFTLSEIKSLVVKNVVVERHGGGAGGWLSRFYPHTGGLQWIHVRPIIDHQRKPAQ